MKAVDAHQHFWHFDPVRDSWINDEMQVIRRDFLPDDLQPVLQQNGMDACVAVQADQSLAQNDFLLGLAEAHPFIKGVVGWVDLQSKEVEAQLQHYSGFPKMKGFRHVLQGEPNRKLMLEPGFKHGISCLAQYGFTYDILIFSDQLPYAAELARAFPNQRFVLDHIAKPDIKGKAIAGWDKGIRDLAVNENVWCKVSGMVTEADWQNWKYEDFVPYLDVVFDAFGIKRLMYGSDWPVCNVAGGYKAAKQILDEYIKPFTAEEQQMFWGGNAIQFYNLS